MPATNGNDVLATTSDGEILHGLSGMDSLSSLYNFTTLYGDAGSDTLRTDLYFAYDPVDCGITQYGGTGNDLLIATLAASGGRADILLDGGTEDDEIDIYVVGSDFAFAPTDFYTMANGGTGRDRITFQADLGHGYGGIVHNAADGGAGDDYIYANSFLPGSNTLNGGTGNDAVIASFVSYYYPFDADNTLSGGAGDDVLSAGIQGDSGTGPFFNSSLTQSNALDGGVGNDTLFASISDFIWIDPQSAPQSLSLTNTLSGGAGNDTVLSTITIAIDNEYLDPGPVVITDDVGASTLHGGAGDDVIVATFNGSGAATLVVTGSSLLYGDAGDDQLTVYGGNGNVLDGGIGNDRLTAGSGQDSLIGGKGADTFVFAAGSSAYGDPDVIKDFKAAEGDKIDLTALGITAADLVITHGNGQNYTVAVDLDHDGSFDFGLAVVSAQPLVASNFMV